MILMTTTKRAVSGLVHTPFTSSDHAKSSGKSVNHHFHMQQGIASCQIRFKTTLFLMKYNLLCFRISLMNIFTKFYIRKYKRLKTAKCSSGPTACSNHDGLLVIFVSPGTVGSNSKRNLVVEKLRDLLLAL